MEKTTAQIALGVLRDLQMQYDARLPIGGNIKQYCINGDCFVTIRTPVSFRILCEGSHDFQNWWDNFQATMIYPLVLKGAGVEQGFWLNLPAFCSAIMPDLQDAIATGCFISVEGHSRGAGMADQLGARLICLGVKNIRSITFGRPNPGDHALAKIWEPFDNYSVWNYGDWLNHDPVGSVPPHLLFPFTQTSQRIIVKVPPGPDDEWGDFLGWHHLTPNYDTGLQEVINAGQS